MKSFSDFKGIQWNEEPKAKALKPKCYADYLRDEGINPKDVGDPKNMGEAIAKADKIKYYDKTQAERYKEKTEERRKLAN